MNKNLMEQDIIKNIENDKDLLKFFFINANKPEFLKPLFEYNNGIYFEFPQLFNEKDEYKLEINPIRYILSIANNPKYIKEPKYIEQILNVVKKISNKIDNKKDKINHGNEFNSLIYSLIHIISLIDIKYIDADIFKCFRILLSLDIYVIPSNFIVSILNKFLDNEESIKATKFITIIFDSINFDKKNLAKINNKYYYFFQFLNDNNNINKIYKIANDEFIYYLCECLYKIVNNKKEYITNDKKCIIKKQNNNTVVINIKNNKYTITPEEYYFKEGKELLEYKNIHFDFYSGENSQYLFEELKEKFNNIPDNIIKEITSAYYDFWRDYTYISYKSLYENGKTDYKQLEGSLIFLLKELFLLKARNNSVINFNLFYNNIYKKFRTTIFKRILLYCYGKEFKKYRNISFRMIEIEKKYLFTKEYFEAEVYLYLQNNARKFTDEEQSLIGRILQEFPYTNYYIDDELNKKINDNKKIIFESWQKKWYSALQDIKYFQKKYSDIEIKEKEFLNFRDSGARWVAYKSPFTEKDIMSYFERKNLEEFYNDIKKAINEDMGNDILEEKPSKKGLCESLENFAKKHPEKLVNKIIYLKDFDIEYIASILYGLANIEDKTLYNRLNWEKIFVFLKEYLSVFTIKAKDDKELKNKKEWLLTNFIFVLNKSIEIKNNIEECVSILSSIHNKLCNYQNDKIKDYTDYYNNIFGVIIDCIFNIPKECFGSNIVKEKVYEIYKNLLDTNIPCLYYYVGFNFNNKIISLYKDYTIDKINNLIKDNINIWIPFFHGFCNIISIDFYKEFKNHYMKAIEIIKDTNIINDFSYIIAFFYLQNNIHINDFYLITESYKKGRFDILTAVTVNIERILYNFDDIDNDNKEKIRESIQNYISYFYNEIKNNIENNKELDLNKKQFIQSFLIIIPFLQCLEEKTEYILKKAIQNTNNAYELHSFFEDLYRLYTYLNIKKEVDMNKVAHIIANLYIEFLNKDIYPYNLEKQDEILLILKENNCIDDIKKINNIYLNHNDISKEHIFKQILNEQKTNK